MSTTLMGVNRRVDRGTSALGLPRNTSQAIHLESTINVDLACRRRCHDMAKNKNSQLEKNGCDKFKMHMIDTLSIDPSARARTEYHLADM